MNSDKPLTPGEELEIRITALLMGELSPEESAALREQLAGNSELQALHTRLARAFDLLRAAVPLGDTVEQITPARLSNERRERLLRRFKATAVSNPVVVPIVKRRWTWLAPLSWAASFTLVIGFLVWQMARPLGMHLAESPDFETSAGDRPSSLFPRYQDTDVLGSAPPAEAQVAPDNQVPPPASAAPLASAKPSDDRSGLALYRGRGLEEAGKAHFGRGYFAQPPSDAGGVNSAGVPGGQPSPLTAKADAASPQTNWASQPGTVPTFTGGGTVGAGVSSETFAFADSPSLSPKPTGDRAAEGLFWDNQAENRPAPLALPGSGPAGGYAGFAANGADRMRTLNSTAGGLVEQKDRLAPELAKSKAETESLQHDSIELKSSLGRVEDNLERFKTAIPGTPVLGEVPITGNLFGASAPDAGARGESVSKGEKETPLALAGRAMGGGGESKQPSEPLLGREDAAKAGVPLAPAKPATAAGTGGLAGASLDSLSAIRGSELGDVNPAEIAAKQAELAQRMIADEAPAQKAQEAWIEKQGQVAAGDRLALGVELQAGQKDKDTKPPLTKLESVARNTAITNGASLDKLARVEARREPSVNPSPASEMDSDFSIVDGGATADQAEAGKKREVKKLLLDADGFADTGRYDLAEKRLGEVLTLDPYNIAAREGKEMIDSKRKAYAGAAYNETRSKMLWELNNAWAAPVRQFSDESGETVNFDTSGAQDWYFKQDGTLAKLTKGKDVDVNGPAGQLPSITTKSGQEATVTLGKEVDVPIAAPKLAAPVPQPEIATSANAFSTFSLNVSDVAFKLAAASLEQNKMPDPGAIRSEEFINAFDYRDPEPAAGAPLAFAAERAQYPFAQNRDLLRLSIKTAAVGRQPGRPLNLVLLVDNSGSMERADRVQILRESLRVLAGQLQPTDKLSIITFARTPHLWVDGVPGNNAAEATARVGEITPQGGTNLSAALDLAYETARKHYQVANINRVVILTDGAANLGDVNPVALKQKVEEQRKQGIALDCFGVGWEGYNDDLLEQLSRNGDGRYGFINSPDAASSEFAGQLAGALRVAASDVKVQVEFNPKRVTAYRQIGYAKHQLTKEQFRDNTVDAAEIGAAESGNALYVVEVNPRGEGDLATVRARFKVPGTSDYREHEWTVPFSPNVAPLEQASPTMRLAATASAFSEWLAGSPYAAEISADKLLGIINGVPQSFSSDPRPQKLEWMIRQAKSLSGR